MATELSPDHPSLVPDTSKAGDARNAPADAGTVHVVLVTFGEPERASYLQQLIYSWRILKSLTTRIDSIPKAIVPLIAIYRGWTRTVAWWRESYRSPLEPITRQQARDLQAALGQAKTSFQVSVAYDFRRPLVQDVLSSIELKSNDQLVAVPMYVADSDFTSGNVADLLASDALGTGGERRMLYSLESLLPELAGVMAEHVRECVSGHGWDAQTLEQTGLILGTHGTLPHPPPSVRETGIHATLDLYIRLRRELVGDYRSMSIAWLNHVRGGKWTQPELSRVIERMREKGIRRFVYYPFGFVADNAETELEGRAAFAEYDDIDLIHVPCVNSAPAFIQLLAASIMKRVVKVAVEQ